MNYYPFLSDRWIHRRREIHRKKGYDFGNVHGSLPDNCQEFDFGGKESNERTRQASGQGEGGDN